MYNRWGPNVKITLKKRSVYKVNQDNKLVEFND